MPHDRTSQVIHQSACDLYTAYKSILPSCGDLDRVIASVSSPLPQVFWANPLKITREALQAFLHHEGIHAEPLKGSAYGLTLLAGAETLGMHGLYRAGMLHIQEAVAQWAGALLPVKPGDRVLDLCSAPGNKTANMAVAMKGEGLLVANDRAFQRVRATGQVIKRLGLPQVVTTVYEGMAFPVLPDYFDAVLVDAPCSGEGTFRKQKRQHIVRQPANSMRLASLQLGLLDKAERCLKPGGFLLYATCTFAPEENEAVLDAFLAKHPFMRLCPLGLNDAVEASPGLHAWNNQTFSPSLAEARRIWPHQNNTGGFFMALLQKEKGESRPKTFEGAASRGVNAPFVGSDDPTLAPYLHKLSLRFALPNNFWKRWRYRASARGYALYPHDVALPFALKPDSVGLFFLKTKCPYPKLSTAAAYLLADAARAHVVRLPPSSVDAYLNQATLYFKDKPRLCSEPGYVLVLGDWGALGLGFMFEREGVWVLQSLFPKRR